MIDISKCRSTRDIDSSSWYTNPDHNFIMTLSALRTKLPIRLASLQVRANQDENCECELLPRPEQLNVLSDGLATEVLEDLRAANKHTETVIRLPRLSSGWHRVHYKPGKKPLEFRACIQKRNNWTSHIYDAIHWTAYRAAISALTDNVRTFVIKLSHKLPVGVRERRCGAASGICPTCIQPETVPHLYLCHYYRTTWRDQFITRLTKHLKDTSTGADLRCTIVKGIQQWFLIEDTSATDEPDTIIQLR
jgi:hypothetical protein